MNKSFTDHTLAAGFASKVTHLTWTLAGLLLLSACSPSADTPNTDAGATQKPPATEVAKDASEKTAPAVEEKPPIMTPTDWKTLPPASIPQPPVRSDGQSITDGELLFQADFESEDLLPGTRIIYRENAPARAARDQAPGSANHVGVIMGAEGPQHPWQPTIDCVFPSVSGGVLVIAFDVYQASYDSGNLGLQVIDTRNGFNLHQKLAIYNDFVQGPGSSARLFENAVTSGVDARWHRVEWQMPLPGGKKGTMNVNLDGKLESNMRHSWKPDGAVDTVRFWLQHQRNEDILYYIDNISIRHVR